MADSPWTVKYCPKCTKDVKGQDSVIEALRNFVLNYGKEGERAALLFGPPGGGKSCIVHALANDLNLELLEINASNIRNEESINSVVGSASRQMSLFCRGKIILVDEIDGIAGSEDRGGISALADVIARSSFPIVMTANDPWDSRFTPLRGKARMIKLNTPRYTSIHSVLKGISECEGLTVGDDVLKGLATRAEGDFRSAINDLQSYSSMGTGADIELMDERNRERSVLDALTKIFKSTNLEISSSAFDDTGEDMSENMLWLEENIPVEYEKPQDVYYAFEAVSKADVFMGRIKRWQYWRFLVYVNLFLSGGVALAKEEKYHKYVSYRRSSRILSLWRVSQSSRKRREICLKIGKRVHDSSGSVIKNTLPYLRSILKSDRRLGEGICKGLGLEKEETEWLGK